MKLTGAQILVECLLEQEVDVVFGYPGGAVLNIYDELYKNSEKIHHVLTAHEQAAAHAADGYARASGRVGVCIATSGPGATNLVTGIATAYMDSVPMVAITGNVGTALLGKDSFQEIDITGVTMPITKHNYIVKDVADLADTIREAFKIAKSGRQGPVLIDIPKDVTALKTSYTKKEIMTQPEKGDIDSNTLTKVSKVINESERPLIYSGGGIISADANEELLAFAKKLGAPVATSLMGLGGIPETHELSTGLIGMHGSVASNMAAMNCDVLIAIGARFSDRVTSSVVTFAPHAKVIHIDIDEAEIGKNIEVYLDVVGDAKEVIKQLLPKIEYKKREEWMYQIDKWKCSFDFTYQKDETLRPEYIIETIDKKTNGESVIITEVGQHQMWAAQFFKYTKPRSYISSGGLGTMGYGTGASIGAKYAVPSRPVVHIAGDGSFRMNCNELATIQYYKVPVIIVVMNNTTLGMVRQWQTIFYKERYSQTTLDRGPDFVKLATAYNIDGYLATTQEEFSEAFELALQKGEPALIDCRVDKDEKVLPMVAPGAAISELILE